MGRILAAVAAAAALTFSSQALAIEGHVERISITNNSGVEVLEISVYPANRGWNYYHDEGYLSAVRFLDGQTITIVPEGPHYYQDRPGNCFYRLHIQFVPDRRSVDRAMNFCTDTELVITAADLAGATRQPGD